MKKFFLFALFQILAFHSFAQDTIPTSTDIVKIYRQNEVDKTVAFIGGVKNYHAFLEQKMNKPRKLEGNHTSGRVIIGFVVDESGSVRDIIVLKPLSKDYDLASINVIKKSNGYWIPAIKDGKNVPSYMVSPFYFE